MQLLAGTDAGTGGGVRVRVRGGFCSKTLGCTGRGWSGGRGQGHAQEHTQERTLKM